MQMLTRAADFLGVEPFVIVFILGVGLGVLFPVLDRLTPDKLLKNIDSGVAAGIIVGATFLVTSYMRYAGDTSYLQHVVVTLLDSLLAWVIFGLAMLILSFDRIYGSGKGLKSAVLGGRD